LFRKRLKNEAGFSLVEVMVSIMILAIAILPMVGMFDMGLNTATTGTKYDRARTLANTMLEQAKMLDYETVRTDFPSQAATGKGVPVTAAGVTSSSVTSCPVLNPNCSDPGRDPRVPQGFCYVVTKQYLEQPPTDLDHLAPATKAFTPSPDGSIDTELLKVTVSVSWRGNLTSCTTNPYQTSGAVAG
jgi:prepilin-type N-terminal cleavage/methylation domain-containing protein